MAKKEGKEDGRGNDGRFLPENKFWRNRARSGPARMFEDPQDLLDACMDYFDWVDDNPLWEYKVFGTGLRVRVPLARAMTLHGLTAHIGMGRRTWDEYKAREEYREVIEVAESVMFEQKFAGAAAGLFNAAIIARDLGLADKREVDTEIKIEVIDSYGEDNDPE